MKYISLIILLFLLVFKPAISNDGAFYARGNQLIPIVETDISVAKEVLTIKRISEYLVEITVLYEFYNPGEAKNVLVGFEAMSPDGDVDGTPKNGQHPYMADFTVMLNSKNLPYKVAIVKDSVYYENGHFKSLTEKEAMGKNFDANYPEFYYVYYFDAHFEKGQNILKHTYRFELSGSVDFDYTLSYVLTAANRWANNQIDDFILRIDMGDFQDFYIAKNFFEKADDWKMSGEGIISEQNDKTPYFLQYFGTYAHFIVRDGIVVFQKKDFHPEGELSILSAPNIFFGSQFNSEKDELPFSIKNSEYITKCENEISKKILRNLPFARRGYVFKNHDIQSYYEKMEWYMPDKNYSATTNSLTPEEVEWINEIDNVE
ncbi:MAG: YARHG domain-containing protein [Bacteroidales bacterium]|nr:YARHG domain-containing protein [Bacteroidales bacterium]